MKYSRFEELPVWNDAIALADKAFRLTGDESFKYQSDLARQLTRAALSVSNNIAEGFERDTPADLVRVLHIARGSAGEVRSMLYVLARNERFAHLEQQRQALYVLAESISRQLKGWIRSTGVPQGKQRRVLSRPPMP